MTKKKTTTKAKPKAVAKPKRKRRTKAQMHLDKIAEQKKAATEIRNAVASTNKAAAIREISDMLLAGEIMIDIKSKIMKSYDISDISTLYAAAQNYMNDNVFKDNISHYANYINELEYLYRLAMGRGIPRPDDTKLAVIDYKEARNILKQKDDAVVMLNQLLQFF